MSPQTPKDPGELSLRPSAAIGGRGKPDFSNVRNDAGDKPDFSNVRGHADTVAAGTQGATYTVRKGDTLSAIAKEHYGKASRWHAIFDANRDQLDDPDLIRPGQVLKLPDNE